MYIYLIVFLMLTSLSLISLNAYKLSALMKFMFASSLLILVTLAAFRGDIDRDHQNYINIYGYIINGQKYLIEPAFYAFVYLSSYITNNYIMLFILFGVIGVTLKLKVISHLSILPFVTLLIYYSNYYFLHEMTQVRVGVAVAICFLSIPLLILKERLKYILLITLAVLFHFSAMIFYLFMFVPTGKINRKEISVYIICILGAYSLYFVNFGLANIFSLIPIDVVQQKFISYSAKGTDGAIVSVNVFSVMQLIKILCASLLYVSLKRSRETDNAAFIYLRLYIYSIIAWVAFFDIPAFAIRISELFGFAEILILPYLVYLFRQRFIGYLLVVFICSISFYVNIYHNELMKPYTFFW